MKGLMDTLANLSSLRKRFEHLLSTAAKRGGFGGPLPAGRLREVADFGTNPGNLRMLTYVPPKLGQGSCAGRGFAWMHTVM